MKWCPRGVIASTLTSASMAGTTLSAQSVPPQVRPDVVFGYFVPLRDLGTNGVTIARLRSGPTLGLGLELPARAPWLAFRLSAQAGIVPGLRLHGTAACTTHCSPFSDSRGRFVAAALDATVRRLARRASFFLGAGAGISGYHVGGQDLTGPAPAGTAYVDPFLVSHTAAAAHLTGGVSVGPGAAAIRVTIEDYIGRGLNRNTLHDLVLAAGVALGRIR